MAGSFKAWSLRVSVNIDLHVPLYIYRMLSDVIMGGRTGMYVLVCMLFNSVFKKKHTHLFKGRGGTEEDEEDDE